MARQEAIKDKSLLSNRLAKRLLPRKLRVWLWDLLDDRLYKRGPMEPPPSLMYDGGTSTLEFREGGEQFAHLLQSAAGLKPHEKVLEVGSGLGMKAVGLTRHLSHEGSYDGLEIVRRAVDWTQERITTRHPNFHFTWADAYNLYYNPQGGQKPEAFRFPYEDATFDVVYMVSVFTHMRGPEVANYLRETARVLKPGGRSFISWFLRTPENAEAVKQGETHPQFLYAMEGFLTSSTKVPEHAICFDEQDAVAMYEAAGLNVSPLRFGGEWCGRKAEPAFYQDAVLATKP